MLEALRADLPSFPDDVLIDWLLPYAKSEGWPPQLDTNGLVKGRWRYLLAGRPLAFYQGLRWSLETGRIAPKDLAKTEIPKIAGMVRGALGEKNIYSASIPNLGERIGSVSTFVAKTGRLPGTPTLIELSDGFRILDGNHRMAVYFLLMGDCGAPPAAMQFIPIEEEQSFWIGRLQC
jgi:hypothetical protein